jgi:hypothetical protein
MSLRELKTEVGTLPSIKNNVEQFSEHWIKPFHKSPNHKLPSLQKLSKEDKKKLNMKIGALHYNMSQLKGSQLINDKLGHYARYLIEMKLTTLNGDTKKADMITERLLNDEMLNMKQTIHEVKQFGEDVKKLQSEYNEVNELLHKSLSLEETLFFMDLPHKRYMFSLVKTSQKQKKITRQIGHHFVKLAKETSLHKAPHK